MTKLPAPGTYVVDPVHSTVGFSVRHLIAGKVRGIFTEFEGSIVIGETAEQSSVSATVQAASITTNNEMRDGHLKTNDFLDLENHPTLTLTSTKITHKSGDDYTMTADLTIRGITKSVDFDLVYGGTGLNMAGGTVVGFEASTEVDRRDFNVAFEGSLEDGSLVVGHRVKLEFEIEAHA